MTHSTIIEIMARAIWPNVKKNRLHLYYDNVDRAIAALEAEGYVVVPIEDTSHVLLEDDL